MEKYNLLNAIFDEGNALLNFVSSMAEEGSKEAIKECKKQTLEDPVEEAFTEGVIAGMIAGFNVGFVYGNMFEVTDPEGKEYLETLREKLIKDGTLMFVPKERVKAA